MANLSNTVNDGTVSLQDEVIRLRKRVNDLEAENVRLTQQLANLRTSSIPPLWKTSSNDNSNSLSSSSSFSSTSLTNGNNSLVRTAMHGNNILMNNNNGTRSAQTSPVRALRPQSSPAVGSSELGSTLLPLGPLPSLSSSSHSSLPSNSTNYSNQSSSTVPVLARSSSAPTLSTGPLIPTVHIPVDHVLCEICNRAIPTASINMHKVHCARTTSKCGHCGTALSIKDIESHIQNEKGTIDALCTAIVQGDTNKVLRMVQHGLSVMNPCDLTNGDTPLHIAARNRRIQLMDLFLSRGSSINGTNKAGETPLHVVCASKEIVNNIDPVTSTSSNGNNNNLRPIPSDSLMDTVSFLLYRGCDVEAKTLLGDTPIQIAQRYKHIELLLLLSTNGGTLRPSSREGDSINTNVTSSSSLPNSRPGSANGRRRLSSLHGGSTNPDTLNLLQNVNTTLRTATN